MKPIINIFFLFLFVNISSIFQSEAQETSGTFKNIFYIRIDTLPMSVKRFSINEGKIGFININIHNGLYHGTGFNTLYNDAKIVYFKKENTNPKEIISYYDFNKFLIKNFYNLVMYCKIYFILQEDDLGYVAIQVRPVGYLHE